jgi:transposase
LLHASTKGGKHATVQGHTDRKERNELTTKYTKGKHCAHAVLSARAPVLLDAGDGGPAKSNKEVSEATGLSLRTIDNLKRTFVEEGLEAALDRKKRETPPRPVVFDGRFEAELTRLACSECPPGHARWTVRLLRDKLVELGIVESVSAMTVCNTLKKTHLSLISANTGRSRLTKTASS